MGGKNKMKGARFALMAIIFGLMFISLAEAAVTWRTPATGSNVTTTMAVNITLALADCTGCHNATIYYNASGGAALGGTLLETITNNTANDIEFYSTSISISSLSDATTYNFTARLYNATGNVANASSAKFTIDNTAPTGAVDYLSESVGSNGVQKLTWSTSDATSGVRTVLLTATSPNSVNCPTQTSSSTSGTLELSESVETGCIGTYTGTLGITDYSGNTNSYSDVFRVYESGAASGAGSGGSLGGFATTTGSIGTEGATKGLNPKIVLVALIILLVYFGTKKK